MQGCKDAPLVSAKAAEATKMILACVLALVLAWAVCESCSVLSSGTPGVGSFPAPGVVVYWHTVEEMQKFAGVEVDGIWGSKTDAAYRAARDKWYCDQQAREVFYGSSDDQ